MKNIFWVYIFTKTPNFCLDILTKTLNFCLDIFEFLRKILSLRLNIKGIRTSLENFAHYENIEVFPMYAITNLLHQH